METEKFINNPRLRIGVVLALSALMAVGFWLRIRNLGALGLELDEGHQALGVRGIFEHGLPIMPSGMVYLRGWPFLYLEAAAAAVFGLDEFALRLPGVLFGTASIAMIYLLGARVFSRAVGLVAALILALSVWEIEFARYARMYTAFQFVYIIALYHFYRGFIEGDRRHQRVFPFMAALAISLHDLGVMLATLFVIPFLLRRYRAVRPAVLVGNAAGIGLFWLVYPRILRLFGEKEFVGTGAIETARTSGGGHLRQIIGRTYHVLRDQIRIPPIGLIRESFLDSPVVPVVVGVVALSGCAYLGWRAWRSPEPRPHLLMIAVLASAAIHQYGLALLFGMILIFLFWDLLPRFDRGPLLALAIAFVAISAAWMGFATDSRLSAAGLSRGEAFFSFPSFYGYFLRWYWEGWPRLTVVIGAGLLLLGYLSVRSRRPEPYTFVAGALLIPAAATSLLQSDVYEARYTFHLFPLIVLAGAYLFVEVPMVFISGIRRPPEAEAPADSRRVPYAVAIAAVLALLVTQDINPVEAYDVGGRSYRSHRNGVKAHINWDQYSFFHQDHRTPALFIRSHLKPGDKIIVMGHPHRASIYYHYIGRVDYVFAEKPEKLYPNSGGRRIHYITGSVIIENLDSMKRMVEGPRDYRIWVLGDLQMLGPGVKSYSAGTKAAVRKWLSEAGTRCEGEDGITFCAAL